MKRTALSLFLLGLSGCAQWCECDKHSPAADSAATGSAEKSSATAVGTDGYVLQDKPMAEAEPAETISRPSQLEMVANDPNARPFLPVVATQSRLTRKLLPSEFPVAVEGVVAVSPYPNLQHSKKQLTDYAGQLGFKLAAFDVLKGAKVGVTSFVEFDDSLQHSNALGNQFAEAMATTLPQHGVEVIDFKLTRKITVSREGDFALSRNVRQLSEKAGMDYILVGTLVTTRRGVQINSRVVSVKGQQVVAAASTLLPHLVLQQIQP
ncbi:MAG: FlgO family outer membrane protein [Rheinheimera sp.]|nr:FlgO family outer membrane protein [Rheinheimera sp.]